MSIASLKKLKKIRKQKDPGILAYRHAVLDAIIELVEYKDEQVRKEEYQTSLQAFKDMIGDSPNATAEGHVTLTIDMLKEIYDDKHESYILDNLGYSYPIDPFQMLKDLGIKMSDTPNVKSLKQAGRIEKNTIFYNRFDAKIRQRFTVAFLIGHYVNGNRDVIATPKSIYQAETPEDVKAHTFAQRLLMPKHSIDCVSYQFNKQYDNPSDEAQLTHFAETFDVSEATMLVRLNSIE